MSFPIAILILLMVWFFLIAPFIKLINVSRQWKNTFTEAQKRAQKRAQQQYDNKRKSATKEPKDKKKKIDPTIGEYIDFTETKDSDTTAPKSEKVNNNSTATESQITDINWEDLPDKT